MERENTPAKPDFLDPEDIGRKLRDRIIAEQIIKTARNFTGALNGAKDMPKVAKMYAYAKFLNMIGAFLYCMDDKLWEEWEEVSATPCGKPDCNCHIIGADLWKALNEFRDDLMLENPKKN